MRKTVVRATLLAIALTASLHAAAQSPKQIDVPPGELTAALQALAEQSGVELIYSIDQLKGVRTDGVRGEYTAEQAVAKLLQGTALKITVHESGALLIGPVPAVLRSSSIGDQTAHGRIRLAQAGEISGNVGAAAAEAADPAARKPLLEEVIVTAQKRSENVRDVPISIVALSSRDLAVKRVDDLNDLAIAVPDLSIRNMGGYGSRQMYMRGVGNTWGNGSQVGMYLDEASVTGASGSQLDLRIHDLERIEVLRGPQGTLWGAGSMGGTIRLITRDPVLDAFGGNFEVAGSFTQDGDPSQSIKAVVNAPLVEDRLGVRIAATYENVGGWIDQPAAARSDINDQELFNVRTKVLWQPTEALRVKATAIVHRNDAGSLNSGEVELGKYEQVLGRTTTPSGRHDYEFYNATVTYDFASFQLLSSTAYYDMFNQHVQFGYRLPLLGPPAAVPQAEILSGGVNATGNDGPWNWDINSLTQELRASSTGSGRLKWTAGVFYRDSEWKNGSTYLLGVPGLLPASMFSFLSNAKTESWSLFGQVSYAVTDRLELGAGTSYFTDDRAEQDLLAGTRGSASFDSVNPRFFASYALTDMARVYASIAKGFRSGGVGATSTSVPYDPDSIWSYEIGTKAAFLDGRLSTEIALFYSDYKDVQIYALSLLSSGGVSQSISNSGDATIKGVDWDFSYRLADVGLSFGFGGNYVDTRVAKINAITASHAVGDPLDQIPRYHFTLWSMYDFDWFGGDPGYARVDYNEQGEAQLTNRTIGPWYSSTSDVIDMLNAAVGWRHRNWLIEIFGQNLLNDRGYLDADVIGQSSPRARPRTFGVSVRAEFQ